MLQTLDRELSDNLELYEMSKDEGDEAGLATIEAETRQARRRSSRTSSSAACSTSRPTR